MLSLGQSANPERQRARLVYQQEESAAACPTDDELRAKVVARLGYDPFVEAAPLTLRATVAAGAEGLVAVITLERDSGGPPADGA